ncbi:MAG TPA: hypothetical protein VES02_18400 [Dermatophilaceae bacterium]|nr:hypothetical protein [Dermatophilaceae bacterium]
MDVVEVPSSGPRNAKPAGSPRSSWRRPAAVGAAAFWSANLVISWTPIAAGYRSALSITYVPMLVEAALGGLLLASVVALVLVRYPERVPDTGPLSRALWLSAAALVLLTVFVEVPSKLLSGVSDPGHWLFVATVFNVIRVLALGVAVGLVTRAGQAEAGPHSRVTERGGLS